MSNRTIGPLGALIAGAVLVLSGCADLRQETLSIESTPDCEQAAGLRGGHRYWLMGESPPRINWSGCDKSGAELAGLDLGNADLVGTNLSGANLAGADLGAAFLSGTDLSNADLSNADITAFYLRDVNLSGANLTGAARDGGTFQRVELSGATWFDGEKVCQPGSMNRCD